MKYYIADYDIIISQKKLRTLIILQNVKKDKVCII